VREYELAIITSPALSDEERTAVFDRVRSIVTGGGGAVTQEAHWGRRMLAYPIARRTDGSYSFVRFRAEPAVVDELDRVLSITDGVLRHKVVRLPDKLAAQGKIPLLGAPGRA
jgi:small subunit ribosomal protein S6